MFRAFFILLIFNLYSPALSSVKENIISRMKITNNLSFDFIQIINEKKENGNCIIEYPKKIFCKYENINKKIIVSNGKSLIIKNKNPGTYYIYPLKKTPLELLLDKNFLIAKISTLEPRVIDNKYLNFTILEKNNEINIFFDSKTFDLLGWQTEDVYQNLTFTFISSIKINQLIEKDFFRLPVRD